MGTALSPSPTEPVFLSLVRGYDKLIGPVQNLAQDPQLPSTEQLELPALLDYHRVPSRGDSCPQNPPRLPRSADEKTARPVRSHSLRS